MESSNLSSSVMNITGMLLYCHKKFTGPVVWSVSSVPCAAVGLPACVWLLWLLAREKTSSSASASAHTYKLNLTVMDLIFNSFLLPTVLNVFLIHNYLLRQVCFITYSFNVSGRPLLTACICADCYMAVLHPITYMRTRQSRYAVAVCAVVWSFTIVAGATAFTQSDLFTKFEFAAFAVALPTISFCDMSILCTLKKPDPSGKTDIHPQKQRALLTITNSLVMSIVAYLPPLILKVVSYFTPLSIEEVICNIEVPSQIFCMLGSTIMPLMHLSNMGKLKDLWRRCTAS